MKIKELPRINNSQVFIIFFISSIHYTRNLVYVHENENSYILKIETADMGGDRAGPMGMRGTQVFYLIVFDLYFYACEQIFVNKNRF